MPVKTVDLSILEHKDKHKAVFYAFDTLDLGEKMLLVDSTNQTRLFNKFDEERKTKLDWRYIEEGPDQ